MTLLLSRLGDKVSVTSTILSSYTDNASKYNVDFGNNLICARMVLVLSFLHVLSSFVLYKQNLCFFVNNQNHEIFLMLI